MSAHIDQRKKRNCRSYCTAKGGKGFQGGRGGGDFFAMGKEKGVVERRRGILKAECTSRGKRELECYLQK